MRFNQIIQSLRTNLDENVVHDVELDEVRMGQKDLTRFAAGELASKMIAGFEAELCFRGLGGDSGELDYENGEPDFDSDESCVSIDDAVRFFHDGDFNSRHDVGRMRERMEEDFFEWQHELLSEKWKEVANEAVREYILEHDWMMDDKIEEYLADELGLDETKIADIMHAGAKADEMTSSKQQNLFKAQDEDYATYMEAVDAVNQALDDYVADSISNNDRNYEAAQEAWVDEAGENDTADEYGEGAWLDSIAGSGSATMQDVYRNYDGFVQWPHYSYPAANEGGYNTESANDLARRMRQALDVKVKAGSGYHSTRREPDLWIIEEDGSLNADDDSDMPCEIVSPPMPLPQCLNMMRKFFEWAKGEDAYSNSSTGLHVGMSMPGVQGKDGNLLDYLKLALFLGDEKILEDFGREGNHYCESSLRKIGKQVRHIGDNDLGEALDDMRSGLIELARKTIGQSGGHGKYSSINLKEDYVEFRGMGGEDYIDNLDMVLNTVQRFAYAYSIAADKDAEREEYGKKLYKLLHKSVKSQDIINSVFVKYNAGEMPVSALKSLLKHAQLQRNIERGEPEEDIKIGDWEPDDAEWNSSLSRDSKEYWTQMLTRVVQSNRPKYWYDVKWRHSNMKVEVVATNPSEAIVRAKIETPEWRTAGNDEFETDATSRYTEAGTAPPRSPHSNWPFASEPPPGSSEGQPVPGSTLDIQRQRAAAAETDEPLVWELYNRITGHVARRFSVADHGEAWEFGRTVLGTLISSGLVSRDDQSQWSVRAVDQ